MNITSQYCDYTWNFGGNGKYLTLGGQIKNDPEWVGMFSMTGRLSEGSQYNANLAFV